VAHDYRFCKAQVIEQADKRRNVFEEHIVVGGDRLRVPETGKIHGDDPAVPGHLRNDPKPPLPRPTLSVNQYHRWAASHFRVADTASANDRVMRVTRPVD
jgi:hypothetical protein